MLVQDIKDQKASKTLVIYGCGGSLNDISEKEWTHLKQFDSIGFNWFILQQWLEPTFKIVGDIRPDKTFEAIGDSKSKCYKNYKEYASEKRYDKTAFFVPEDKQPNFPDGNLGRKSFLYKRSKEFYTRDINSISVAATTLTTCLHVAIFLKYKRVIFAGVDLYDYNYFFMHSEEPLRIQGSRREEPKWRDDPIDKKHPVSRNTLKWIKHKSKAFRLSKIRFYSFNHKSLLLSRKMIHPYNYE